MSRRRVLESLSDSSRALLRRARRGAESDPEILGALRDDLIGLTDNEIADLWKSLAAEPSAMRTEDAELYRLIDKARRKLALKAARFRSMLLEHARARFPSPPPRPETSSLRALVDAYARAGRGKEILEAAEELVRTRSMAYDIT